MQRPQTSQFLLLLSLLFLLTSTISAQKNCYAPDGVTVPTPGYEYKPCISIDGVDSMCCATNRTGSDADTCAQNGLYLNNGIYWRDFCTDASWNSPNCLPKNTCADRSEGTQNNTSPMTQCIDGSWCCGGNNNTDCCSKGLGFKLDSHLVKFTTTTNTSSNSTSTAIATAIATVKSSSTSDVMKVGVGVGVSLGVLAITGSMLGFWLGQRRGLRIGAAKGGEGGAFSMFEGKGSKMGTLDAKTPMLPYQGQGNAVSYQDQPVNVNGGAPQEVAADQQPTELGTDARV